jgi:hypothetical protein
MKKILSTAQTLLYLLLIGLRAFLIVLMVLCLMGLLGSIFSCNLSDANQLKPRTDTVKPERVTIPTMAADDTDLERELIDSGAVALRDTASRIP